MTKKRVATAGLAFVLTLATTTLLWTRGREFGQAEARRPTPSPQPVITVFSDPKLNGLTASDYQNRLAALQAKKEQATSKEQKRELASAFLELALNAHFRNQGEGTLSLQAYDEALALWHSLGDKRAEANTLMNRATTIALLGQPEKAELDLNAALATFASLPETALQQAEVLYRLGDLSVDQKRYPAACTYLDRSLRIRQKLGEKNGEADCLSALGQAAFGEGQRALARQLLGEAASGFAALGKVESRAAVLGDLGDVALAEGELDEASRYFTEGLAVWKKGNNGTWVGKFLTRQARVALAKNDLPEAERLANESLALFRASNSPVSAKAPLALLEAVKAKTR